MRKLFALLAALSISVFAAACGGDDSNTAASTSTTLEAAQHNDADVTFLQGMIPHHAQAVEMADMALDNSLDAQVLDLAERIKAAQQPEIDQMTGWLEAWGEPVGPAGGGHGMGDMSGGMGSMMSDEEMSQLGAMTGAGFDRMWLDMMIRHHEGAIEMAEQHQEDGQNPEALALGEAIITVQQAEITEMRVLLG